MVFATSWLRKLQTENLQTWSLETEDRERVLEWLVLGIVGSTIYKDEGVWMSIMAVDSCHDAVLVRDHESSCYIAGILLASRAYNFEAAPFIVIMAVVARPDVQQLEAAWSEPNQLVPGNEKFEPLGLLKCYRVHVGHDYFPHQGYACYLSRELGQGARLWRCERGGLLKWMVTRPAEVRAVAVSLTGRLRFGFLVVQARMLSGAQVWSGTYPAEQDVKVSAVSTAIRRSMLVAGRIQSTHVLKVMGHKLLVHGRKIWSCNWSKTMAAKKLPKKRLFRKTDPRFLRRLLRDSCFPLAMAAAFLNQLHDMLHKQKPIMGDHFDGMLAAQKDCAVRAISQHKVTTQEAAELCSLIQQGPWNESQKKELGKAVSNSVSSGMMAAGKKKKGNQTQEVDNFFCFLSAEDKQVLAEASAGVHSRCNHIAEIMEKMGLYWPSEKATGHIVSTMATLQSAGLQSPDDFHGAVKKLKTIIKSRLKKNKDAKDHEFVAVYKEPAMLPEIYRSHFEKAEAGELPASSLVAHGPLRGSHKSLSSSSNSSSNIVGNNMMNHSLMKKMMADGNGMSMMGLMSCISTCMQQFQQQSSSLQLPGFKLLGKAGGNETSPNRATSMMATPSPPHDSPESSHRVSSPVQPHHQQLAVAACPVQPHQQQLAVAACPAQPHDQQLAVPKAGQEPVGPAEQARQTLAAWNANKAAAEGDEEDEETEKPRKKPAAKLQQTKSVLPKKKPAAKAKSQSQPKLSIKNLSMSKRLKLKVFTTQRALAQILKEIRELDELPAATGRSSVKRAREELLHDYATPYGPIYIEPTLQKEDGTDVTIPILSPAAMLAWACEHCAAFGQLLQKQMALKPPTYEKPWTLIWYSDQIAPGNQLKHVNRRKAQVIYWSLQELGAHAMSCESCWFTLTAVRSTVVADMGGMAVLFRQLARFFFETPDWRQGLLVNCPIGSPPLFADLGILISDEAAIKQTLCNKGASGLVFCVHCQNAVDHKSHVAASSRGTQVSSLETDISRFRRQTKESIKAYMDYLAEQKPLQTKTKFEKLQTALGFNFKPMGLLAHAAYGPKLIDCIMFDWTHVYLVSGLFNVLTGLFLGDLHHNGWKHNDIERFARTFTWPARLRRAAPKDVLQKRGSYSDPLKCSASEALNFLQVLRTYLVLWVLPQCNEDMRNSCEVWLAMCKVLDALQKIAIGDPFPAVQLQVLVKGHLDLAKVRYGEDSFWVPKCHLALHLPLQLAKHSGLMSCFVHERKHKIIKKITNQVLDTSRAFEKSTLDDVLHGHLQQLADPAFLPGEGVHLVQPVRPAPAKLQAELRRCMNIQGEIMTANQAVHAGNFTVSAKDLAALHLDGERLVGRVGYHVQADGTCWSHVTLWNHVHGAMFTLSDDVALVETKHIHATCAFSVQGDSAVVVLP
ncbi:unnamed protein product [Symbiodinium sp. CCMP2592]|nr:unnamed protein product [Symbiodinium sp. CCMP2592]